MKREAPSGREATEEAMRLSPTVLSLPALQRRLDSLVAGQRLSISRADYRRLFGDPDDPEAQASLANFARGHGCEAEARTSVVVFEKL